MKEQQKWLILESDDDWQIIMPDVDIQPHSTDNSNSKKKDVAYIDCPCLPKIDYLNKIIIHNSFRDSVLIDKSLENIK